jgi:hypothetical protein
LMNVQEHRVHRRGGPPNEEQRRDRRSAQNQQDQKLHAERKRIRKSYGQTHQDDKINKMDRALHGESVIPQTPPKEGRHPTTSERRHCRGRWCWVAPTYAEERN